MTSMQGNTGMAGPTGRTGSKVKGYNVGQVQQFTPEMMQLYSQLFSHVGPDSYLSKLASGDQSTFGEIEAPALQQFNEIQGNLASRFSGQGTGGRKGSAFQNASTAASSNFAQQLQSNRQALQRQAIQDLRGFSMDLLGQRPYETTITEKSKPWWQSLLMKFGESAAEAGGKALFSGGGGGGGGVPIPNGGVGAPVPIP